VIATLSHYSFVCLVLAIVFLFLPSSSFTLRYTLGKTHGQSAIPTELCGERLKSGLLIIKGLKGMNMLTPNLSSHTASFRQIESMEHWAVLCFLILQLG
jgi:hypothetical protein